MSDTETELKSWIEAAIISVPATPWGRRRTLEIVWKKITADRAARDVESRLDLIKAYIEISEGEGNGQMIGHFRTDLKFYEQQKATLQSQEQGGDVK